LKQKDNHFVCLKCLGHSQIATTLRYCHLASEQLAQSIATIGDASGLDKSMFGH
jgi:site-specific recombinase XerC